MMPMPNSWASMIQQPQAPQPVMQGGQPPQNIADGMQPNYLAAMLRARQQGFMPPNNGAPMPYQPIGAQPPSPWGGQPPHAIVPPMGVSQPQQIQAPQMPPQANSFLRRPVPVQF